MTNFSKEGPPVDEETQAHRQHRGVATPVGLRHPALIALLI
jgi:hypothetical protein